MTSPAILDTAEASRLREERYRTLIASMAQIVWTTDARGQVIEDQPEWRAFTGQTSGAIIDGAWLMAVHPDSRNEAVSGWSLAVARGLPYETEWRLRRRDGEYRCFSIHAAPVRADDGSIGEWIGCNIDITDRRLGEEEMRGMHAKADLALVQLERCVRETQILKNLGDTLQACNTREEAYPFIALAATELFPGTRGGLAVPVAGARELLETAAEWGADPENPPADGRMKPDFSNEDCWALRRGAMHQPGVGTVCRHFKSKSGEPQVCIPLVVRGQVSGLLSVQFPGTLALHDERREALSNFGNAVAVGLSTLHLRETLHESSIRG